MKFVPLPSNQLWNRLSGPGHLPGELLGTEPGRSLRFRHTGVKGWLPVSDPIGELQLEAADGGTHVRLELTGTADGGVLDLVTARLKGYVEGSLASRLRGALAA